MIPLDGEGLTPEAVVAVAREGREVGLSPAAKERVAAGEALLRGMIADGTPIYGVTTGFGALDGRAVSPERNRALQHNLLRSHAAGVGAPMADDAVRAMMVIRANVLATGLTGVTQETLMALIAMLNAGVVPQVPERGSVGACGDLAPLAHMVLPLIGDGRAHLGEATGFPAARPCAWPASRPPPSRGATGSP